MKSNLNYYSVWTEPPSRENESLVDSKTQNIQYPDRGRAKVGHQPMTCQHSPGSSAIHQGY